MRLIERVSERIVEVFEELFDRERRGLNQVVRLAVELLLVVRDVDSVVACVVSGCLTG